ncbi:hypothetical protein HNR42_002681 [Deinobacterium chartae]|uniref:Lipoprotein n=1 Tax=Deinobacterium chartae TaxID=521158 RepID=A0A841I1W3_9DEIO|nr:hypothetical protein [Deinobacterium chartae]MBB6099243.1 hypothetical protein [Deinobacterium chartae]
MRTFGLAAALTLLLASCGTSRSPENPDSPGSGPTPSYAPLGERFTLQGRTAEVWPWMGPTLLLSGAPSDGVVRHLDAEGNFEIRVGPPADLEGGTELGSDAVVGQFCYSNTQQLVNQKQLTFFPSEKTRFHFLVIGVESPTSPHYLQEWGGDEANTNSVGYWYFAEAASVVGQTRCFSGATLLGTVRYNLHFKPGWNRVVKKRGGSAVEFVTGAAPQGLKWEFRSYPSPDQGHPLWPL